MCEGKRRCVCVCVIIWSKTLNLHALVVRSGARQVDPDQDVQ